MHSGRLSPEQAGGPPREIPSRGQPRAGGSSEPSGEEPAAAPSDEAVIAAVVMAAGRSRRMGEGNKLLEEVEGIPMVEAVVRRTIEAGLDPVVVVTGHEAERVEEALGGYPVVVVRNLRFEEGMGTSLATGIGALGEGVGGALICLADMPRVRTETMRALSDAFRGAEGEGASAWVPVHRGKRGNPVLWNASSFPELARLHTDVGGRSILAERGESVREVEVDDPGILVDADTREDLERLRRGGAEGT